MGECVIVYGKSGSGKSRSLLNFGEDEIFLVNSSQNACHSVKNLSIQWSVTILLRS